MSISRRVLPSAVIVAIVGAASFALVSIQCADAQGVNPFLFNLLTEDGGKNKGDDEEKGDTIKLLSVFQQQNFLKQLELARQQQTPPPPPPSSAPARGAAAVPVGGG